MSKSYRAVRLRLYPNSAQEQTLLQNCGAVRWLYNRGLAFRIRKYEKTGESVSKYAMMKSLPRLKDKFPWLKEADSTSLQQALHNLDTAYQNFWKHGRGFPQFKKKGVRDSFRVVMSLQYEDEKLKIGKHGWFSVRGSVERVEGRKIKSVTVTRDGNHWYASCLIEWGEHIDHIHRYEKAGIDVGVKQPVTLCYLNDVGKRRYAVVGQKFSELLDKKEKRRKRYQRQIARKQKGSNNRTKARYKVQGAYRKERNFRKNWIEQISHKLASRIHTVAFEDLRIKSMTKSARGTKDNPGKNVRAKSGLNREMLRLGLGSLMARTQQKAAYLGGIVTFVNPRNTSRTCPECGTIDKDNRKSQAVFKCVSCGHRANADKNAARNILALAA